ncbi:PREDICTED: uncharacterized protein LOC107193901 [Dufourea novaeangliae]|uniref:uncharacterized protein LOC107193901 n=1 Tax=Dufourea novaeangliae TaxID=178035 RepID=UPI0007675E69|nr:PREDICTED: uncharacterized protein LOC107193901 [Dufourea novaeangliae]
MIVAVLFGLLGLGYALQCPRQKTSPGREVVCYTSVSDVEKLSNAICRCTTLVHQGYDVRNLSASGFESFRKSLKAINPALQFMISVDDPAKTLRTSGTVRQEITARLLGTVKDIDGVELNMTAGSRERLVHFVKGLKDELVRKSYDKRVFLVLPSKSEDLAKQFDLKELSKYVDLFTVPTHHLVEDDEDYHTFHPSRLMGIFDMFNADSLIDLISGLGAPKRKILVSVPASAYKFSLKDQDDNTPRSPTVELQPVIIDQKQLCDLMNNGEWTVERDEDLTAPYAFKNKTWIAFEDKISIMIKVCYVPGLYFRIENDFETKCGKPITHEIHHSFTDFKRKSRAAVLNALEDDLHQTHLSYPTKVKSSEFRVVRVVDTEGHIRAVRENTQTEFTCSRQGYFVHPKSCNRFYRCVKFNQEVEDYSVFEFDCPAGLAFDEHTEVCVWPGSLSQGSACPGSSEIAPVTRVRFECPSKSGYYADPQNPRWFFACIDLGGPEMMAYEFRCPFGLIFDEHKLVCEWPWLVPGYSDSGYTRTEYDNQGSTQGTGGYFTGGLPHGSSGATGHQGGDIQDSLEQLALDMQDRMLEAMEVRLGRDQLGTLEQLEMDTLVILVAMTVKQDQVEEAMAAQLAQDMQDQETLVTLVPRVECILDIPGLVWNILVKYLQDQVMQEAQHIPELMEFTVEQLILAQQLVPMEDQDIQVQKVIFMEAQNIPAQMLEHMEDQQVMVMLMEVILDLLVADMQDQQVVVMMDLLVEDMEDLQVEDMQDQQVVVTMDLLVEDILDLLVEDMEDLLVLADMQDQQVVGMMDLLVEDILDLLVEDMEDLQVADMGVQRVVVMMDLLVEDMEDLLVEDLLVEDMEDRQVVVMLVLLVEDMEDLQVADMQDQRVVVMLDLLMEDILDLLVEDMADMQAQQVVVTMDLLVEDMEDLQVADMQDQQVVVTMDLLVEDMEDLQVADMQDQRVVVMLDLLMEDILDLLVEDMEYLQVADMQDQRVVVMLDLLMEDILDLLVEDMADMKAQQVVVTMDLLVEDVEDLQVADMQDQQVVVTMDLLVEDMEDLQVADMQDQQVVVTMDLLVEDMEDLQVADMQDQKVVVTMDLLVEDMEELLVADMQDQRVMLDLLVEDTLDLYGGSTVGGYEGSTSGGYAGSAGGAHAGTTVGGYGGSSSGGYAGSTSVAHGGTTVGGYEGSVVGGYEGPTSGNHVGVPGTGYSASVVPGYSTGGYSGPGIKGGHFSTSSVQYSGSHGSTVPGTQYIGANIKGSQIGNSSPGQTIIYGTQPTQTPIYVSAGTAGTGIGSVGGVQGHTSGTIYVQKPDKPSVNCVTSCVSTPQQPGGQSQIPGGYVTGYEGSGGSVYPGQTGITTTYFGNAGTKGYGGAVTSGTTVYQGGSGYTTGYHGPGNRNDLNITLSGSQGPSFGTSYHGISTPSVGYGITGTYGTGTIVTGNNIHGSIATGDSSPGTLITYGETPGTVISGSSDQGTIVTGGNHPGYVKTGQGTPGYVISGGVKTVYTGSASPGTAVYGTPAPGVVLTGTPEHGTILKGEPSPGIILTGQTAPGVTLGGSVEQGTVIGSTGHHVFTDSGYIQQGDITVGPTYGTKIEKVPIDTGYKINEYHDNGGRGTIKFNNGEVTTKYTENDIPDYRPAGGTIPPDTLFPGYNTGDSGLPTPHGFTKTGPTKTGITTATLGGHGSYTISTGKTTPTPKPDNIGAKAFEGNVVGYTKSSTDSSVKVYPGSTPSQDVNYVDTSKITLGPSKSTGYSYPRPNVPFKTGSTPSTVVPVSSTEGSVLAGTTPTPYLNVEVYNSPKFAGPTVSPAVVDTYTGSTDGYYQGKVSTGFSRGPVPTATPVVYTTGPLENYKTTAFEAAKIPVTISTVHPVFDNGYKTIVSSTPIPVTLTQDNFSGSLQTGSISTQNQFDFGRRTSQLGGHGEQGYVYSTTPQSTPGVTSTYTISKPRPFGPSISVTEQPQINYVSSTSSGSEYFDSKSSFGQRVTSSGISESLKPQTQYLPSDYISPAVGVTYRKPFQVPGITYQSTPIPSVIPTGGSPTNVEIPRNEVGKLITNYNRGTTKYVPSQYDIYTPGVYTGGDISRTQQSSLPPSGQSYGSTPAPFGRTQSSFSNGYSKSSSGISYQTTAKSTAVGNAKVIVKWSDLHPLLLGKLGAECTCKGDPFANLRGPGSKLINSSKGKVDLANYDDSEIYVDLEKTGSYEYDDYVTNQGPIKLWPKETPAPLLESGISQIQERPSSTYLPSVTPSVTVGLHGSIPPSTPVNHGFSANYRSGKSLNNDGSTTNSVGKGASFDRYGPGGLRDSEEVLEGATNCARPGLFRHPNFCNKFYACHWDDWKKKFTLHVFNCPVHLTFDNGAGACNWPSMGPACQDDNLLV